MKKHILTLEVSHERYLTALGVLPKRTVHSLQEEEMQDSFAMLTGALYACQAHAWFGFFAGLY